MRRSAGGRTRGRFGDHVQQVLESERTAVDAAPWLVGETEPKKPVPPEEVYDKLKPFKDRVADDIKRGEE